MCTVTGREVGSQLTCRYRGSTTRAEVSRILSRTHIVEQSKFTSSHLLGFVLNESAYSMPLSRGLSSGQMKALPGEVQA
jgi:hypothetical protein